MLNSKYYFVCFRPGIFTLTLWHVFFIGQFSQQTFDPSNVGFGSQSTREYGRDSSPEWLHMQIGGGFERTS